MKIMITGASGYFGTLLSEKLKNGLDGKVEIIGIDVKEMDDPEEKDMKFLSGDTRKKRIEDVFKVEGDIDAVIHLARETGSDLSSDELMMTNVYGTFHMLELAQKYNVNQFIFPSASIVYGARNDNPALISESHPLLGNRDIPRIRDRVEADMLCQTFVQQAKMKVVILRFVPIWREKGEGTLQKYMSMDNVPTLMGFDPMFQIIYEDEVLEAFLLTVKNKRANGAYNIPG
ncbi:MAG: NAD-dependent epimerase/dehydratase family protein, partial [bacterium]